MAPDAPTLDEIRAASRRLAPYVALTPLLRLCVHDAPQELYLKLENLQPLGSFKTRPIGNALLAAGSGALEKGVYTTSSGNAGVALAGMARRLGVPATVYAPRSSPSSKLEPIKALGARVETLSDDAWWHAVDSGGHPSDPGLYVDAVRNPSALAGNGTIGLEILEQVPDVDTVIVPFGGGGIACGIASAIQVLKPGTRIIAAESDAAAPATAALREGRPVTVPVRPSFISGAGAPSVLAEMWPLIRDGLDGTAVVPVARVAEAIRLLFTHIRVVVEGAGAISVAAALAGTGAGGKTVCVVTGGNIGADVFSRILDRQPV